MTTDSACSGPTDASPTAPPLATREVAPGGATTAPPIERDDKASETTSPPVEVTVFHGGLDGAHYPVIVGHYRATPLSGAEGFIDGLIEHRLSERYELDDYPGAIGESLHVKAPRRGRPHRGAVIVGLGDYGDLTPLALVETVREALVSYALDHADESPRDALELGISSVLLAGTGDQGLNISASVRAIVDAIRKANRDLSTGPRSPRARYRWLQLWERNAPEAELAYRAVDALQRELPGVIACAALRTTVGALTTSIPVEASRAAWWRIRVAEKHVSDATSTGAVPSILELEFTVGGRLARNGNVVHRVERHRLERLLSGAVAESQPGHDLHVTLFELLFPNALKWDLMAAQDIQLEVDDTTADIPWEMLAARNPGQNGRGQLALRAPLVRQLRLANIPTIRRAAKPTALVIGNPPAGPAVPSLAGAYEEAIAVADVLGDAGNNFTVTSHCYGIDAPSDDATIMEIETSLFADDYRIIHIAGHGNFQPEDPTRTGVLIGPDVFLTARTFGQLNVIPDLVFLNCCHLGAMVMATHTAEVDFTRRNLNRLGASLARELIDSGVRAVVVAGWAVEDTPAKEFARIFYERMLAGDEFARAVHAARTAAWDASEGGSTWGAYQCYGDGGYRLPADSGAREATHAPAAPLTAQEAMRRVESLVSAIESVGFLPGGTAEHAASQLAVIESQARESSWVDRSARLCEELARAHAATDGFAAAIAWLEAAVRASDGSVTLRGIEQFSNFSDRLAASLIRNPDATDADRVHAQQLIDESLTTIECLEQIGRSGERAELRSAHYELAAVASTGEARVAALRASAAAHLAAFQLQRQPCSLLSHIQIDTIRSATDGSPSTIDAVASAFREITGLPAAGGDADFLERVTGAESALTQALVDGDLDTRLPGLIEQYLDAFGGRSTAAERTSTLDRLLVLADLHPHELQAAALVELHRALTDTEG